MNDKRSEYWRLNATAIYDKTDTSDSMIPYERTEHLEHTIAFGNPRQDVPRHDFNDINSRKEEERGALRKFQSSGRGGQQQLAISRKGKHATSVFVPRLLYRDNSRHYSQRASLRRIDIENLLTR